MGLHKPQTCVNSGSPYYSIQVIFWFICTKLFRERILIIVKRFTADRNEDGKQYDLDA